MTTRHAACSCGQLRVRCEGDPVRISMCHCLACQRRTGSIFGVQARFPRENVASEGRSSTFLRKADSGNTITFHFCPDCGATVFWTIDAQPDLTAVAVGAFADPSFPAPRFSVFESKRHSWAMRAEDLELEHRP
ncbi:MAG: GFA family protein [Propylenella sp.]